jgi:putative membrane protein
MQLSRIVRRAATAAALVVATASCARGDTEEAAAAVAEPETARLATTGAPFGGPFAPLPQQPIATFTATDVVNIAAALDQGEVRAAQLALTKATSPDVRAFAQHMVNEHTQSLARSEAIAQRMGIVPGTDPTSAHLQRESALLTRDLESIGGPAFDMAFMTGQITAHAKTLGLIDQALVPSANRAGAHELEDELRKTRRSIVDHTARALDLQNVLRGGNTVARPLF